MITTPELLRRSGGAERTNDERCEPEMFEVLVTAANDLTGVVDGPGVAGVGLGLLGPNLNGWLTANAAFSRRGRSLGG